MLNEGRTKNKLPIHDGSSSTTEDGGIEATDTASKEVQNRKTTSNKRETGEASVWIGVRPTTGQRRRMRREAQKEQETNRGDEQDTAADYPTNKDSRDSNGPTQTERLGEHTREHETNGASATPKEPAPTETVAATWMIGCWNSQGAWRPP